MAKKSSKTRSWHSKQNSDVYVKKSRAEGYRSRASYKLLEINEKDHILKPEMIVVDLGSTPGGWSQVAKQIVGPRGKVIALDILEMEPITDVDFIHGDFTSEETLQELLQYLDSHKISKVDVVISDMAPNLSGIKTSDQANSIYLVELALQFAQMALKPGGTLLVKAFHGARFENIVAAFRQSFDKLLIRKPNASRSESKEVYLLATGYNLDKV